MRTVRRERKVPMSASLLIKAEDLSVGDVLLLPFEKTATVATIRPIGPRTHFVNFKTEYGWTRVAIGAELSVQARVAD
jgi:hypothetical protein